MVYTSLVPKLSFPVRMKIERKAFFVLIKLPERASTKTWVSIMELRVLAHLQSTYTQLSPLYLLSTLYITHVINYSRPSTAFPHYKWWKAGRGLGTRLPPLLSPLPYMEKDREWGWGSNPMTSHDVILWHPMKAITDLEMHTWRWWWQNASLTTKIYHIFLTINRMYVGQHTWCWWWNITSLTTKIGHIFLTILDLSKIISHNSIPNE